MDAAPRILAARYEVGDVIGRGGMAEVYLGRDARLGRTVAIKILRSDLARDPSFRARFRREAQSSASLNHPSIVAVHDTGEDVSTDAHGTSTHVPFIVMEYIEGHTVHDILRDGHAVPIDEAVEITAGVLSALEHSHHAGIVHRDIKPANVMLTAGGAVKVMDFGIARAMADSAATMTGTQSVLGTAQYLSPEQARGERVDARSDLYSTGCLLFELLTGRPPFTGDSALAVAYQHVREQAPAPSTFASDVPEALDRVTLKALAKDRDDRYSTAAEFRADLEAALRGDHVSAPAIGVLAAAMAGPVAGGATQILAPVTSAPRALSDPPATAALGRLPMTPDDEPPRRRALLWTPIAIAIAAVLGIGTLLYVNSQGTPTVKHVTIPNLTSESQKAAFAELTDLGLTPVRQAEASAAVDADSVTRTDPTRGTSVAVRTHVNVYLSTGPAQVATPAPTARTRDRGGANVSVPDVTGRTEQQARTALQAAGFVVGPAQTSGMAGTPGDVTNTAPIGGSRVATGSTVTLYVVSGNVRGVGD